MKGSHDLVHCFYKIVTYFYMQYYNWYKFAVVVSVKNAMLYHVIVIVETIVCVCVLNDKQNTTTSRWIGNDI